MSDQKILTDTYAAPTSNSPLDALPKLSACAVVITAVVSMCGYTVAKNYFQKLGAPWAVDLLTPQALIFMALPLIILLCVAVFYGARYGRRTAGKRKIPWWTLVGLIVSTICLAIIMRAKAPEYGFWAGNVLIVSYAVVVAGSAAEVAGALVKGKTLASPELFVTLESIAVFIFFFAPPNFGSMLARRDADPKSSPLAVISIEGKEDGHWRLVRAFGDKTLLIKLADDEKDREFQVVATDKLKIKYAAP